MAVHARAGARLQLLPWITLVVLKEDEFTEAKNIAGRPLPFITIHDASILPPANELWAWAHVHFNQSLSANGDELVSPDMMRVLPARAIDSRGKPGPGLFAAALSTSCST